MHYDRIQEIVPKTDNCEQHQDRFQSIPTMIFRNRNNVQLRNVPVYFLILYAYM